MADRARTRLVITARACLSRPEPPWLTITVPPWLARILIAAGAQESHDASS